jgi:hypothetical protein
MIIPVSDSNADQRATHSSNVIFWEIFRDCEFESRHTASEGQTCGTSHAKAEEALHSKSLYTVIPPRCTRIGQIETARSNTFSFSSQVLCHIGSCQDGIPLLGFCVMEDSSGFSLSITHICTSEYISKPVVNYTHLNIVVHQFNQVILRSPSPRSGYPFSAHPAKLPKALLSFAPLGMWTIKGTSVLSPPSTSGS